MRLNLDKTGWKRVTFGEVADASKERCDPTDGSVSRYIAGEHMETGNLHIARWGQIGDGYLGPAFHRRFRPGQVLYGSRRTYLRKVAVVEFDGVCSNTTFVVDAKPHLLLPEFLPFVMSAEPFHAHAVAASKGSVNPYVNWSDLVWFEFDLPPLHEQQRIADLLWALEAHAQAVRSEIRHVETLRRTWLHRQFADAAEAGDLVTLNELVDQDRPICYGVLMPGPEHEGGRMIVDVKDYPAGKILVDQVRRCDPGIEANFARSRLRTGDVLLSIRGTIGRTALVPAGLAGHNISRDSARIACDRSKALASFVRLALDSPDVQAEIRRTTTGLAVKGINVAKIRSLRLPCWDLERQQATVDEAHRLERMIASLDEESAALVDLRRALLQEILGGLA